MNWLAHLSLASDEPLARLGQLAGDFVRGTEIEGLAPELRAGIAAHRALDAFTDTHPAMRRSRARVLPPLTRWSGVLCDVFYDHILAADFERYGPGGTLAEFVAAVHAELLAHVTLLPPRLRAVAPRLVAENWLISYASVAGVETTLRHMERRVRRPVPLREGVADLRREFDGFRADFEEFWGAVRERSWAGSGSFDDP